MGSGLVELDVVPAWEGACVEPGGVVACGLGEWSRTGCTDQPLGRDRYPRGNGRSGAGSSQWNWEQAWPSRPPSGKGKTQGSVQARQTLRPQPGGSSWAQQPDFLSLQQPGCLVRIASGLGRAHFAMGGVCL